MWTFKYFSLIKLFFGEKVTMEGFPCKIILESPTHCKAYSSFLSERYFKIPVRMSSYSFIEIRVFWKSKSFFKSILNINIISNIVYFLRKTGLDEIHLAKE